MHNYALHVLDAPEDGVWHCKPQYTTDGHIAGPHTVSFDFY